MSIERIKITEVDTTEAAVAEEDSLDVVYVPGLIGFKYVTFTSGVKPLTKVEVSAEAQANPYAHVGDTFINMNENDLFAQICTGVETTEASGVIISYSYSWADITFSYPAFTQYDIDGNYDFDETVEFIKAANVFTMLTPIECYSTEDLIYNFGTRYFYGKENVGDSLTYATDVIAKGLPIVYHCGIKYETNAIAVNCYVMTASAEDMLNKMNTAGYVNSCFYEVADLNEFDVKYITSGVYSAGITEEKTTEKGEIVKTLKYSNILTNMIDTAKSRGDAFALIDSGEAQTVEGDLSLYKVLTNNSGVVGNYGTYAAAFAPWGLFSSSNGTLLMPASLTYLSCYADSIVTNGSHMAIAGVNRGIASQVSKLDIPAGERLSNAIADSWQDPKGVANVNGITFIRNYGYTIWGNRTLHNNAASKGLIDSSFLSIRNMLCDIKKVIRNVAIRIIFEPNSDRVWSKFLFGVEPILERYKADGGIGEYRIIKQTTDDKTKLKAVIKLVTVKPIETVEVSIVLTDEDITIE